MKKISELTCLIDLHLHLDGAISPASARQLAKLQGIPCPASETELLKLLRVSDDCRDLNEFLEKFDFPCSLLMTKEGVETATSNLLSELKAQGVMYAEIRFAPQLSVGKGLTQEDAVLAALEAIRKAEIDAGLILCCLRRADNHAENLETVELAAKYLHKGVCALDLAGAEALFPALDYADLFEKARELGVPYTIHAGEADGPESVRAALSLGAYRIGHGVRSMEDPALVKTLAEKQIPLQLCPTSNICTCIFSDISEYPLRAFLDAGVIVTVNTDDPAIEGTTLREEYEKLKLTAAELKILLQNSVRASFADDALKEKMLARIEKEFA